MYGPVDPGYSGPQEAFATMTSDARRTANNLRNKTDDFLPKHRSWSTGWWVCQQANSRIQGTGGSAQATRRTPRMQFPPPTVCLSWLNERSKVIIVLPPPGCSHSVDIDRNSADADRDLVDSWPKSSNSRPELAGVGSKLADSGRFRAKIGRNWPSSVKIARRSARFTPKWANSGPSLAEVDRHVVSTPGRSWPVSAERAHDWGRDGQSWTQLDQSRPG